MDKKQQLFTQAADLLGLPVSKLAGIVGVAYSSRKWRGMVDVKTVQHQALDRLNNYLVSKGYEIAVVKIDPKTEQTLIPTDALSDYWEQSHAKSLTDAN